nr:deoxyribodipyrimidine photo-lyase [Hyphomonas sp. Mor2]
MSGVHVLWFRQDLRVHDHAPLKAACLAAARDGGRVVPLFLIDPKETPSRFLVESLKDLDAALEQRGGQLHYRQGDPAEVLSELHRRHNLRSLHLYETALPSPTEAEVEAWCMRAGVAWRMYPQFGPELSSERSVSAAEAWDAFMAAPRHEAPGVLPAAQIGIGQPPAVPLSEDDPTYALGGRKAAIETMRSVLGRVSDLDRIATASEPDGAYAKQLAPYLELGLISVRETWQAAVTARNQYLAAGQDIRAARVTDLIRHLPDVWRARLCPAFGKSPSVRARPGGQLSLDL